MPIRIPNDLPARQTLLKEGVMVMTEATASRQDIRPLRIGLLNLMPNKIDTETQLARLIGPGPLQIELSLVRITHHEPRHTSAAHMSSFYRPWEEVRAERFDGLIITGAPVERIAFEEVTYWDELRRILIAQVSMLSPGVGLDLVDEYVMHDGEQPWPDGQCRLP